LRGEERERVERQRGEAEEEIVGELEEFERQRERQQEQRRRRRSPSYERGARRASSSEDGEVGRSAMRMETANGRGNGHGGEDDGVDGMKSPPRRRPDTGGIGMNGTSGEEIGVTTSTPAAEGSQPDAMQVEAGGMEVTPAREPGEDNDEIMVDAGEDAVIY